MSRIGLVQRRLFRGYELKKASDQIQLRTLLHLGRHGLEQLRLVRDASPEGQFCMGIIERIVANASSVPANRTLADVLHELHPPPVETESDATAETTADGEPAVEPPAGTPSDHAASE